jgi:ribonuclease Z
VLLVSLLGTGCPQVYPDRFGPASLVCARGRQFLIDCGSGVTQRLVAAGSSGAALDAVLLTHLHSDHVVDLYQLIISSWHQGRDRAQRIFGPAGTRAFAEATLELWRSEREARIAWERRPSTAALELDVVEFAERVIWDEEGVRIAAFEVDHRSVQPAFGFLVEAGRCRVAFSGDTTVCDNLIAWAKDVDLLVHECFIHEEMLARRGGHADQGLQNVAAYHTFVVGGWQGREQSRRAPARAQPFRAGRVRSRCPTRRGHGGFRRPGGDRRGPADDRCGASDGRLRHAAPSARLSLSAAPRCPGGRNRPD